MSRWLTLLLWAIAPMQAFALGSGGPIQSDGIGNFTVDSDKIKTGAVQTEKLHSEALNDTAKQGGFSKVTVGRTSTTGVFHASSGTLYLDGDASAIIVAGAANTAKLTLTAAGNLGIGTANPLTLLDVAGGPQTTTGLPVVHLSGRSTNQYTGLGFGYRASASQNVPAALLYREDSGAGNTKGSLLLATRGTTTDIAPTVRLGISAEGGVTVPGSSVTLRAESNGNAELGLFRVDDFRAASLQFGLVETVAWYVGQLRHAGSGTSRWCVSSNSDTSIGGAEICALTTGEVGIGVASPLVKLDVAGRGKFTGEVTFLSTVSVNASNPRLGIIHSGATDDSALEFYDETRVRRAYLNYNDANGHTVYGRDGVSSMTLTTSGGWAFVGTQGATFSGSSLTVTGAGADIKINDTSNNPGIRFEESGSFKGEVQTAAGVLYLDAASGIRLRPDAATSVGTIDSNGLRAARPANQDIAAGGTITADACGGVKSVSATGSQTTSLTDTITAPAAGNDGCCMDIVNVDTVDTITLDLNANNNLAADTALGPCDMIRACSTGAGGRWFFNAVFAGTCN